MKKKLEMYYNGTANVIKRCLFFNNTNFLFAYDYEGMCTVQVKFYGIFEIRGHVVPYV